jgi:hypothetical protein
VDGLGESDAVRSTPAQTNHPPLESLNLWVLQLPLERDASNRASSGCADHTILVQRVCILGHRLLPAGTLLAVSVGGRVHTAANVVCFQGLIEEKMKNSPFYARLDYEEHDYADEDEDGKHRAPL